MGHYLLGFVIGAAAGAAVVAFTSQRSGPALRAALGDAVQEALTAGKAAQTAHEQKLWVDFRAANAPKPTTSLAPLDGALPKVY